MNFCLCAYLHISLCIEVILSLFMSLCFSCILSWIICIEFVIPSRDCARISNNLAPKCFKLSAKDGREKQFFLRLHLVPGLHHFALFLICPFYHHALGAHTPTAHSTTISRFLYNFSQVPLNLFVYTIHQVIWPSREGTGTLPAWDYLVNRNDTKIVGPFWGNFLYKNREKLQIEWSGLWVHRDSWLVAQICPVLEKIKTSKIAFAVCVCCFVLLTRYWGI